MAGSSESSYEPWVSQMALNALTSKDTISLSSILLYGVNYTKEHMFVGTQHFKCCVTTDLKW